MTTGNRGLLFEIVGTFSTFLTMSIPSRTLPKTTCLPSRKLHFAQVMKNWQPFVFVPEFAIDNNPAESCLSSKDSSANIPL